MKPKKFLILILVTIITISCARDDLTYFKLPKGEEYFQRGYYLAHGLAACGHCHGDTSEPEANLSGGHIFYDNFGRVVTPNITPHKTGIADWTVEQVLNAIRSSLGREEEKLSIEAHEGYVWMSDSDVLAIASYLSTVPPIENSVERREIGFTDSMLKGFFDKKRREVRGYVPNINKAKKVKYGKYLVDNVARCGACHTNDPTVFSKEVYLGGGKTVKFEEGEKIAPSLLLTKDALGEWSMRDIVTYLRTGNKPNGEEVDSRFCPVNFFARSEQSDLESIAEFLISQ